MNLERRIESHSELLVGLAEQFLNRHRSGERPPLREYTDLYPELADEIREVFPALARLENIALSEEPSGGDRTGAVPSASTSVPERLGDFRILREVGRGGMGVVYEAEQVSLGRRVALKVLPHQMLRDPKQCRRFEREARAAARLHHTNIVPVFGVGEHEGTPYYAMQFIQGQGLDAVLDELKRISAAAAMSVSRGNREESAASARSVATTANETAAAVVARSLWIGQFEPPGDRAVSGLSVTADQDPESEALPTSRSRPERSVSAEPSASSASLSLPGGRTRGRGRRETYWQGIARIGAQVASALAYAHAQGVVHRDIKPSNLLLDNHGTVWITDFGLAKAADDQDLTQTGDILGTLRFMPPEAFEGRSDARGDIYSLGLTLYEMLAFRPAFDEKDRGRLVKQVSDSQPPRLGKLAPDVPRDLETIVHKASERSPGDRYATADDLVADLQRFLDDQPILARRASLLERYARWARHHPGIAILGGVLTAVLVVATIASLLAAGHFNRLRQSEARAAAREKGARYEAEKATARERDARHEAEAAADEARRRGAAERWERYRSNIAAAAGALQQQQNSATARIALDAAPVEHRNWEWQHFHSQLDGARLVLPVPGESIEGAQSLALSPSGKQFAVRSKEHNHVYLYDVATGRLDAVLRGHSAPVEFVGYRPDGKQLATGGWDRTIRLWDPATGREQAHLRVDFAKPKSEGSPIVVYSPDGNRIVSFARDDGAGTSRLWDPATGKQIAVLGEWQGLRRAVAFSPDGKLVAVTSSESVCLCDAGTGRPIAVLGPHEAPVALLAYSPDGKRIASVAADAASRAIHLWDGATGKEVALLRGHTAEVLRLLFSPDGSRLVSGSDYYSGSEQPDGTARLWDAASGRLLAVLAGHKNRIWAVAFSPDGNRVVTASGDQTARLWDGRSGQLRAVLGGHTARVQHVAFSPNGSRVVTASDDATLRLWDAETGELISVLRGHGSGFRSPPVFTPDGSTLVSGCTDGTVRIWDVSLLERNGILRGHWSFVCDVAFSPDGEHVASSAWDGTVRLWDARSGRQTGVLKHATGIISSVAFSHDGRRLATVERDRGLTLWDVASRKPVLAWSALAGDRGADTRAVFNPAGTLLAAGCAQGPVRLWDASSGQEIAQLKGHERCSTDVAFHPDGQLLATAGEDGTVRLWDVATRAPLTILRGHQKYVRRVAFSSDGKQLASGSDDKTIRFWDARSGRSLGVVPAGSRVLGLAFSPDGTRLAAGCDDNTVCLIDVAARQQVAELRGHAAYVQAVAWSPDGTRLVSSSGDFTLRVWDALPPAVRARPRDDHQPPER